MECAARKLNMPPEDIPEFHTTRVCDIAPLAIEVLIAREFHQPQKVFTDFFLRVPESMRDELKLLEPLMDASPVDAERCNNKYLAVLLKKRHHLFPASCMSYDLLSGEDARVRLFENEKINKRVLAIRGLRPDLDFKDLKQAPRMGAQTVLKLNLDTGNQYKKDYEDIEDYLLNLPNYKDVVITGHSRGGQTGLELARKHKLKAHIFQPVSVKNIEAVASKEGIVDMKDSSLSEDDATITFTINERRIYTNKEDTTPSNLVNPTDTSEKQYIIDYDPSLHSNTAILP